MGRLAKHDLMAKVQVTQVLVFGDHLGIVAVILVRAGSSGQVLGTVRQDWSWIHFLV